MAKQKTISVVLVKTVTYVSIVEVPDVDDREEAFDVVESAMASDADEQKGLRDTFGDAMSEWEQQDDAEIEIDRAAKVSEPKKMYACSRCGCTDIQTEAWADMNSGEAADFVEGGDNWCPECEEHDKYCCLVDVATGKCEFHPEEDHTWKLHPYVDEPEQPQKEAR